MTSCVALIPARYGSTRLPAKALLRDTGKYLIQHVYEQVAAARTPTEVIVCTDDERIMDAVGAFGGKAVMTSAEHQSGSDRVAEVAAGLDAELILNVQGDEPGVSPVLLDRLVDALAADRTAPIYTAGVPIKDRAVFDDPNAVKVVADGSGTDGGGRALYFSRSPIPHGALSGAGRSEPLKHLGVYAYRREALLAFSALRPVALERTERLEQLRALCHGMAIGVIVTDDDSPGIDTAEDYAAFVKSYTLARGRPGDRQ